MENQQSMGDQFLTLVRQIIEDNISNENFTVSILAKEVGLSRSMLHRKLTRLIGKSATTFITEIRLERAWELLESDVATVSEIAYKVGFSSPSYFTKVFKKNYHIPPGEVRKKGLGKRLSILETARKKRMTWRITSIFSFIIIAVMTALLILLNTNGTKGGVVSEKSVAVLPFHNFSGDPHQDTICLGLTDEIIYHLYKIQSFDKVSSLTSVLSYKDPERNATLIANELSVNYILEGSFKKIGERIIVTAQLIEAKSDKHIWHHKYDQPYKEIIAIQADIALQIAEHVNIYITNSELLRIKKVPTSNQRAYELMQRAMFLYHTNLFEERDQIKQLIHKAIELDPYYANAYAVLGHFILAEGYYFGRKELHTAIKEALPYFEKTLELDHENSYSYSGIAAIKQLTWDYIESEQFWKKSIGNLPGDKTLTQGYSQLLLQMNKPVEARVLLEDNLRVRKRVDVQYDLILSYIISEDFIRASSLTKELVETYKEQAFNWAGRLYTILGNSDSAKYYFESAHSAIDPRMLIPRTLADLGYVYYKTGDHANAKNMINHLIQNSQMSTIGSSAYSVGWYYSGIGEVDSAFAWLEKAYKNRSPELPWLKVDPAFDGLKGDERYWDLYERTGHKAYDDYMASKKE